MKQYETGKVVYLEIGIGFTTPQFIKTPFQKKVTENPNAVYVSMNHKHYRVPLAIRNRTLLLSENIATLIHETHQLLKEEGKLYVFD